MLLMLATIARQNNTLYETHPSAGGAFFTYETDRFGGCFLTLYVQADGTITNTSTQKRMTLGDVQKAVPELRDKLLKHRDLAVLADFINDQYD